MNSLTLNTLMPEHPDMLLAISFMDGRGAYAKQAAELARNAPWYVLKDNMHICAFGKDLEGAMRALAILDFIGLTRGCHIHTASPMYWGTERTTAVLRCYCAALQCDAPPMWCQVRNFPCRRVELYYSISPCTLQAAAIEAGVDWCPFWHSHEH